MPRPVDRRTLLRATGAATLGVAVAGSLGHVATASDPAFAHGVASGDPLPNSVLLWTRVTPTPESQPGSGVGPTVTVGWEVAADPAFAAIVASGSASTGPGSDHTVKVDATGLAPTTRYYYRFRFGTGLSATGVTRTAPAADATVSRLRFGVVSCSDYRAGYFGGYRYL
ncbi:MAG TPA: PhoD-like phosphatase N-terminal domain-containing protein, partial [Pseudonocardiaceae bacterium]|nr:PhoD-like phosphatase N-terminal domain-containing protein [Pseudonocardiaceae bacterium]